MYIYDLLPLTTHLEGVTSQQLASIPYQLALRREMEFLLLFLFLLNYKIVYFVLLFVLMWSCLHPCSIIAVLPNCAHLFFVKHLISLSICAVSCLSLGANSYCALLHLYVQSLGLPCSPLFVCSQTSWFWSLLCFCFRNMGYPSVMAACFDYDFWLPLDTHHAFHNTLYLSGEMKWVFMYNPKEKPQDRANISSLVY